MTDRAPTRREYVTYGALVGGSLLAGCTGGDGRGTTRGTTLSAVEAGNVHRAGGFYQGPIINLSLTERAARQLYPGEFDASERLYDRQRVADIVSEADV
jgi:hypothetical protein